MHGFTQVPFALQSPHLFEFETHSGLDQITRSHLHYPPVPKVRGVLFIDNGPSYHLSIIRQIEPLTRGTIYPF
jgi:hypothetical protein